MTRFQRTRRSPRRLLADRTGVTMVEYALLGSLIALTLVGAIGQIGDQHKAMIQSAVDGFTRPADGD